MNKRKKRQGRVKGIWRKWEVGKGWEKERNKTIEIVGREIINNNSNKEEDKGKDKVSKDKLSKEKNFE